MPLDTLRRTECEHGFWSRTGRDEIDDLSYDLVALIVFLQICPCLVERLVVLSPQTYRQNGFPRSAIAP
jgi:hypothetical protein